MAPKRKLIVVKQPLGYKQEYKPITFPPLPQLYLDLIENKDKIKPDLRDKLFEPRWDSSAEEVKYPEISVEDLNSASQSFKDEMKEFVTNEEEEFAGITFMNKPMQRSNGNNNRADDFTSSILRAGFSRPHSEVVSDRESPHGSFRISYSPEQPPRSLSSRKFTKVSDEEVEADRHSAAQSPSHSIPTSPKYSSHSNLFQLGGGNESNKSSRDHRSGDDRDRYERSERYERSDRRDERRDERDKYERSDRRDERRDDKYDRRDESEDEISNFLAADVSKPKPSQSVYSNYRRERREERNERRDRNERYSPRDRDRDEQQPSQNSQNAQNQSNRPMGLDDINRGMANKTRVLNMPQTSKAEEERNTKRGWLLYQFERLRRMNPEGPIKIPEFSAYTEVEVLEREYNQIVRQLEIESNVVEYKKYLQAGFGIIEWAVKRFLHFEEIQGFALEQMVRMNQYDKVLYELGERYQPDPTKPGWPPELKLMAIVLFNAATFVMMKMFIGGAGNAMFNNVHMSGMGGAQTAQRPAASAATASSSARKPMQGPDIDLDAL